MSNWNKTTSLLLIFIFMFIGCSQNYESIRNIYNAEKLYFKAGNIRKNIMINPQIASPAQYQNAEIAYRKVVEQYGEKSQELPQLRGIIQQSWLTIAELYLMQKNFDKAIEIYQEIISKSGQDKMLCGVAQYSIGTNYERMKKIDDAIRAFNKVIEEYPPVFSDTLLPNLNILQTPIHVARLYQQKGDIGKAKEQYRKSRMYYQHVSQKYANSIVAMAAENHIAVSYGDEGDWRKATSALKDVLQKYDGKFNMFNTIMELANIYQRQLKDPQKALHYFDKLLTAYADNPAIGSAYLGKGNVLLSQNRYASARENFQKVIDSPGTKQDAAIQAQMAIAHSYELQNNWQKALHEYLWVADNYSKSIQAIQIPLYIADYYKRNNQNELATQAYENAIHRYQSAINLYPGTIMSAAAFDHQAMCYMRLEEWSKAVEVLNKLLTEKLPPQSQIQASLTLASIYEEKLADMKSAVSTYKKIAEKFPTLKADGKLEQKISELESKHQAYLSGNKPPLASNIIKVNQMSETSAEILWQKNNESDFSAYKLYRSNQPNISPINSQMIAEITEQTQTQVLDTEVQAGEKYYYKVVVSDRGGLSSSGNEMQAVISVKKFVAKVALSAKVSDWSSVLLSWSQVDDKQFDSYKVYRANSPGVNYTSELVKTVYNAKSTQVVDDNLKPESTYFYKVFAQNAKGKKQASNEIRVQTPANEAPAPVVLNRPLSASSQAVELSWQGRIATDFSMFRIYRSEGTHVSLDKAPIWMSSNKNILKYKDSGLMPGKSYYYKVVVYDKGGLQAASNEVMVQL